MHWQTHTVFNQPSPLCNSNLFLSDTALREAVVREGAGWDSDLLASIGTNSWGRLNRWSWGAWYQQQSAGTAAL
ncbi:hypothetical protein QYS46_04445 [Klebsiella michiganensis]|nr:hypothetical protein [Klebsiella michiganensis]